MSFTNLSIRDRTSTTRYIRWVERNLVARYAWSQWHSILEKASCLEKEGERARKAERERNKEVMGEMNAVHFGVKSRMIHNAPRVSRFVVAAIMQISLAFFSRPSRVIGIFGFTNIYLRSKYKRRRESMSSKSSSLLNLLSIFA